MRAAATLLATLAMALTAFGLAVAAPGGGDDRPRPAVAAASGAVSISNSREGQAVFDAAAMRPGEGVSGTVRIGNDGDAPGRFAVRPTAMQDAPGPGGGRLSQALRLVLSDVTDVQHPVTVYAGAPATLGEVDLGLFAAGAERDYLVAATLPASADNRFQGAALALGFEWRAGPAPTATATPTPRPKPTPTPKPRPKPTPTPRPKPKPKPTPAPPAADPVGAALADALGLPPARRCVSRRRFRIHLKAPHGAKVVSAKLVVAGRRTIVKRGRRRATVDLRGLSAGRFKLRISVRASNGRTYRSKRTYRTCGRR